MKPRIGRRRLLIATLEVSATLGALIVAFALFAFGSYVSSMRGTVARTMTELESKLPSSSGAGSAEIAAIDAASHYLSPDVVLVFVDASKRVVVYRSASPEAPPVIDVRARGDLGGSVRGVGPFSRIILGAATAFGLQSLHSRVGSVDVFLRGNDAVLTTTAGAFVIPLLFGLILAIFAGYAIAQALTAQMMRPLVEVTAALERFASGDLTPQPIDADIRQEFGPLAVAYNAAILQMERAFAEREHANAAMRQFIADAGHQLRTPLTVIRGFLGILLKGELRTPEDRDRIIETMNKQSQVMGSLIEKLMLLEHWESESSSPHSGVEPIDVGQLIGDVTAPIVEANADRTVRIDAPPGELAAIDPSDLAHVVTNLLDNALKYTRGSIDVRVGRRGERVVVEVRDEGPGMAPEVAAHVFDRFFRGTRRDVVGSGLGLSIAKGAIERAGGTLALETDPARGSCFSVALPSPARIRPLNRPAEPATA